VANGPETTSKAIAAARTAGFEDRSQCLVFLLFVRPKMEKSPAATAPWSGLPEADEVFL